VRRVNPVFVNVGRSFNASRGQMIVKVYLPALVPAIVNGMRLGLGLAIIGVLLGEIKLSDRASAFSRSMSTTTSASRKCTQRSF